MIEKVLLGDRSIDIFEPQNLEAILSTQFRGKYTLKLSANGVYNDLRFQLRCKAREFLATSGSRHFHSGRRSMEGIQRSVATAVYADPFETLR